MMTKRICIGVLVLVFMVAFVSSCKKDVKVAPDKPQTTVKEVDEKTPKIEEPTLTDEEIFQRQSIEELNQQGHLKRIHFDFDKYFVREDMKPILESNAAWLLKFPTVIVQIGGHCDERGTEEYNMALGEKRAMAAQKYLISLGVSADRLKIVSYGKTQPLVRAVDEESYFMNRRAELKIIKK